jgi:hypothetical protein
MMMVLKLEKNRREGKINEKEKKEYDKKSLFLSGINKVDVYKSINPNN